MPRSKQPEQRFPLEQTHAPCLADRLKLDEPNQRVIDFAPAARSCRRKEVSR